ncbi:MAG: uroporphyrinogen decarboxylase family protein [Anaerolineae bacterium]|nr:uroporphyrinogen decarboxylase family protein [Anaerolineae bacterium]
MLSPRDRVRAVFAGERPDRPVVDLGGRVASLSTPAYLALKAHLGYGDALDGETVTLLNTIGAFDERVLQRFDVPFRRVYLRPAASFTLAVAADGSFRDEWGVGYRPTGPYNERIGHPLAEATLDDLEAFPWPDPHDPGRVAGLAEEARRLYETSDYALAAGHIGSGVFQDCWNLRGMARFMLDMAADRDFAEALLDRVLAVHVGMWEHFLDAVGDYVEMVETADDLGGQDGLLISPQMYRDLVKPRHAALNEALRARTNARIFYHSCGAIMGLIDDLIEIGVQVLNPIQPLPGHMDPEALRRRYGDRLVFHGGLDVQTVLPDGAPDDVRRHVRRYLDALGPERYIMAPANSVQPGTPPENIIAAFDEAAATS